MLRPLGNTSLSCYPLGFGSYRVNEGNPVHEAALRSYLDNGGNLVDTSSNYGDGLSEILVGRVVKDFVREKIIVVTKAGYMQGQNLSLAKTRAFPEVVEFGEGLWHCIHPEFLESQVEQSLRRMKLEVLDVFLLHNPEYFINYTARFDPIHEDVLDIFYGRIRKAFEFLEAEVQRGTIGTYGISSNHFGFHLKDRARVSVERILKEAQAVSPDHHCRVIQMPLNLFESGGALFPSNNGQTVLDFCRTNGLGVLINRPLNAIHGQRMVRLADFVKGEQPGPEALDEKLTDLAETEHDYLQSFGGDAFGVREEGLAAYLKSLVLELSSADQWEGALQQFIIPPVTQWLRQAQRLNGERAGWPDWQKRYVAVVNQALDDLQRFLQAANQVESDRIRTLVYDAGYPETGATLSQIALSLVLNLEGVSGVLCGMRSPAYVRDAVGALNLPAIESKKILASVSERMLTSNLE